MKDHPDEDHPDETPALSEDHCCCSLSLPISMSVNPLPRTSPLLWPLLPKPILPMSMPISLFPRTATLSRHFKVEGQHSLLHTHTHTHKWCCTHQSYQMVINLSRMWAGGGGGDIFIWDLLWMEFMYPVFTCMPGNDSGLSYVTCYMGKIPLVDRQTDKTKTDETAIERLIIKHLQNDMHANRLI